MTTTRERSILLHGWEVRAFLEGRKTQIRRPITRGEVYEGRDWDPWPYYVLRGEKGLPVRCPYGKPGDRLIGKEAWCREFDDGEDTGGYLYRADWKEGEIVRSDDPDRSPWKSPVRMPRAASRLTLGVVSVRVERVQAISEEDARAEGCPECPDCEGSYQCGQWGRGAIDDPLSSACGGRPFHACRGLCEGRTEREWFAHVWDEANGKRAPWASNPWAWVLTVKPVGAGKESDR